MKKDLKQTYMDKPHNSVVFSAFSPLTCQSPPLWLPFPGLVTRGSSLGLPPPLGWVFPPFLLHVLNCRSLCFRFHSVFTSFSNVSSWTMHSIPCLRWTLLWRTVSKSETQGVSSLLSCSSVRPARPEARRQGCPPPTPYASFPTQPAPPLPFAISTGSAAIFPGTKIYNSGTTSHFLLLLSILKF